MGGLFPEQCSDDCEPVAQSLTVCLPMLCKRTDSVGLRIRGFDWIQCYMSVQFPSGEFFRE